MSITIKEWITEALNSDYDPCTSDWNMQGYIWCLGKFLCAEVDQNTNETCKKWYKDLSKINRGSVSERSSFGTLKNETSSNPILGWKIFETLEQSVEDKLWGGLFHFLKYQKLITNWQNLCYKTLELNYWMSSRTNPVQKIVEVMSTLKATNSVTNRALMTILKLPFQNQLLGE